MCGLSLALFSLFSAGLCFGPFLWQVFLEVTPKMRFTRLPMLTFALLSFAFTSSTYAKNVSCKRYLEMGTEFSENFTAYESWFPKEISINANQFEEVAGKKYIRSIDSGTVYGGSKNVSIKHTLFPNGKLTANSADLIGQVYARYKCDMTPNEVLKAKTGGTQSVETVLKTLEANRVKKIRTETDELVCSFAADNGEWYLGYPKYVEEAKRRGLSCGTDKDSTPATISPITISSSIEDKTSKAEEKCTSLGFTAGTEKHGDCVMKLLDY